MKIVTIIVIMMRKRWSQASFGGSLTWGGGQGTSALHFPEDAEDLQDCKDMLVPSADQEADMSYVSMEGILGP